MISCFPATDTERKMSSVIFGSGLNTQFGNPVRREILGLHKQIDHLRAVIYRMDENIQEIAHKVNVTLTTLEPVSDAPPPPPEPVAPPPPAPKYDPRRR
jgi:hypothetical protein